MKRTLCMLLLLCLMPLSFSAGGEGIFYEAEDYIRDYDEFLNAIKGKDLD